MDKVLKNKEAYSNFFFNQEINKMELFFLNNHLSHEFIQEHEATLEYDYCHEWPDSCHTLSPWFTINDITNSHITLHQLQTLQLDIMKNWDHHSLRGNLHCNDINFQQDGIHSRLPASRCHHWVDLSVFDAWTILAITVNYLFLQNF